MKITPETLIPMPDGSHVLAVKAKIYDCMGHVIPYVISYDTDSKEVEICVKSGNSLIIENPPLGELFGEIARFKAVLPGSYCEVNGVRVQG